MADEEQDIETTAEEPEQSDVKGASGEDKGASDDSSMADLVDIEDFLNEEEAPKEEPSQEEKRESQKPDRQTGRTPEQERDELLRKNKELNRALHEERQKRKTDKGEDQEAKLTDQQLIAIMKEYKDDEATMLNIVKHTAQQAALHAAKKTVNDADTEKRRKETEDYVYRTYPDLVKDDSELRIHVNKTKQELQLADHPYGELLGTAVTYLMAAPQIVKNAYEKGKSDAEASIADKNRKRDASEKMLTPKGRPAGEAKTIPDTRDVAERLGLKSPRQVALLNKLTASAKGARTVSVEG